MVTTKQVSIVETRPLGKKRRLNKSPWKTTNHPLTMIEGKRNNGNNKFLHSNNHPKCK